MTSHMRTVSPSTHPRPASNGATDFLLASALSWSPTGLATSRWRRRAMRPTDVCHPNETTCTRTSCVPGSLSQLSLRGRPTETKAPRGTTGGLDVSRRPGTASADRHSNTCLELYCLTAWRHERGRFLPTVLMRSSL